MFLVSINRCNEQIVCVTQFVLNSACEAAENALIDQRIFFTSDKKYRAFLKALEKPAEIKPKLQKLMRNNAPWEK